MKRIVDMTADEYLAVITNPATNNDLDSEAMFIPSNKTTNNELAQRRRLNDERDKAAKKTRSTVARLDQIPTDRAPSGEELVQFERDREQFLRDYNQFV